MSRPLRAMVLAAGLGTRLGPLSDERPKPLLPVADYPLIRYNLALLAAHGFREVAINLHHRGDLIVAELDGATSPLEIHWSTEEPILGTGGGLKRIGDFLTRGGGDPFVVVNGKLVIDVDLGALVAHHRALEAEATMVVREVPDPERWGAVDVDAKGRVRRLLGEGLPGTAAHRTMFTGVHVVGPELLRRLPEGPSCVIRQGYLPALRDGARVGALLYDGYFQEHSNAERYLAGNIAVLDGEARLRHPPGRLDGVDPTAAVDPHAVLVPPYRVGPGATVESGAVIGPFAVVGRRSLVLPKSHLARTVVWPDAVASGRLDRAIVTPRGVLHLDSDGGAPRFEPRNKP